MPKTIVKRLFITTLFVFVAVRLIEAQSVTAVVDNAAPEQGQQITVTLNIDAVSNIYYFESEISYEPASMVFDGVTAGDLMGDPALSVADNLSFNRIGASVSRTSGSGSGPGSLMVLTFTVQDLADTTDVSFSFSNLHLKDGTGDEIAVTAPSDISVNVQPAITNAALESGSQTIHEAQSVTLSATAFAHTVTDSSDSDPGPGIKAWLAIHSVDTDPSTWPESDWQPAAYSSDQNGSDVFQATFGPGLMVGSHYYAVRVQLKDGSYKYGGYDGSDGGFWDGSSSVNGQLTVTTRPPYHTKIAEWNFEDQDMKADRFVADNQGALMELAGAEQDGFAGHGNGFAADSKSWDLESGVDKYWMVHISTTGFDDIRVSSAMSGSGSGPRDFLLQYSLDGNSWTDVSGDTVKTGEGWTEGVVDNLLLPAAAADKSDVYLRWFQASDKRIDGDDGVYSGGKLQLDDVVISGVEQNPVTVSVWPGDTDQDGSVGATDVLGLGVYWLYEGESRIVPGTDWAAADATAWHPAAATYADTDGSGQVNQSDLLAIGMNYGLTAGSSPKTVFASTSGSLEIPALREGDELQVYLTADPEVMLQGLSWEVSWEGIKGSALDIDQVEASSWSSDWDEQNELLTFMRKEESLFAGAIAHKGQTEAVGAQMLLSFRLTAIHDFDSAVTLSLKQCKIVDGEANIVEAEGVGLDYEVITADEEEPSLDLPRQTTLEANYPNPFNPQTVIAYKLAHRSPVRLSIYDIQGRKVAELVNEVQSAGKYEVSWEAARFASGVYLYRLQADGVNRVRKMMLIK